MKKLNYILLFICVLSLNLIKAQDKKESKFNIIASGGIGYGIVENDNEPNYNLNSNNGDILLNYRINQKFGIASGIGMNELTGNGFNSLGNFYHERTMIKIPLLATMNYSVTEKSRIIGNFGFYGQNITKDEYRYINNLQKNVYDGWNFGFQLGLGYVFEMSENLNIGLNFTGQSDFSKFETKNNQLISDKQKLKNLNSIGILLVFNL